MAVLPTLTLKSELRNLMRVEFHHKGATTFDHTEPDNFIKRLTVAQKKLLEDKIQVPENQLTAFITFGDGIIDNPMGSDFCEATLLYNDDTDYKKVDRAAHDSVRPNASLAVFFKNHDGTSIELAFYTRHFVINYQMSSKFEIDANYRSRGKKFTSGLLGRDYCHQLNKKPMEPKSERESLHKKIFETMGRRKQIAKYCCNPVTLKSGHKKTYPPRRYAFFIHYVTHKDVTSDKDATGNCRIVYFPYLHLKERRTVNGKSGWYHSEMMKGQGTNKVHGVYPTRGCWMFLRNYTWKWPNEDKTYSNATTGGKEYQVYKKICDCIKNFNRWWIKSTEVTAIKALPGCGDLDTSEKILHKSWCTPHPHQPYSANYSYYRLINLLGGLEYNKHDANIEKYSDADCKRPASTNYNCWKKDYNWGYSKWVKNVYSTKKYSYSTPWMYVFMFKRTKEFTPYPGDQKPFE